MSSEGDSGAEARVEELLEQPESKALEFKTELRDQEQAAQLIAAMANSGGGRIVLGANEEAEAVGLEDPGRTRQLLEWGAAAIAPQVSMSLEEANVDGRSLLLASLQPGQDQRLFVPPDGAIRRRDGQGRSIVLSGSELIREATAGGGGQSILEGLMDEMNRSLEAMKDKADEAVEEARVAFKEAKDARSWQAQILGWLISGVIGAVIGVVATALL